MTGLKVNSEFCFPEKLNEVEGKPNSLFTDGPVIKCFVVPPDSKIDAYKFKCSTSGSQTELYHRSDTIIVFFLAANNNKNNIFRGYHQLALS